MTNDLKNVLVSLLAMSALSPDGGYGGISMCISCKENGRDKYKDEETGEIIDFCERCPNNMTNAYRPMN